MNYWNQTPLFRLVFPFVFGILTAIYTEAEAILIIYLGSAFLLLLLVSSIKGIYAGYKFRSLFGIFINVLLFLAGYQATVIKTDKFQDQYFGNADRAEVFLCNLKEPLQEKEKTYKVEVEIYGVKTGSQWKKTIGKALIYFEKSDASSRLKYGDCIQVHTPFTEIKAPQNPSEFNYRKYLAYNRIYTQAYVSRKQWKTFPQKIANPISQHAYSLREKVMALFKKYLSGNDEYTVASALVIGAMDEMDRSLLASYSGAGVIHVLSVSGLHVGLVYVVLNSMLFFMERLKALRLVKVLVLIGILWFYALITGFSPSVSRAVMMLTLLIFGQSLGRYTNTYNTLAASAFLLLLYNPYFIMSTGFQLSYLAVSGILFLHPKIYSGWETDNYLLDKTWQLVSVSIAAHVFTFPLVLFYFHQLPNYFIIANLVVIPLATAIMYAGIVLVFFSKWIWLSEWMGYGLSFMIKMINSTVRFVESLPWSIWKGVSINPLETCVIYLILALAILVVWYKKTIFLRWVLFLFLMVMIHQFYISLVAAGQKKIVVYSITDMQAIDFIDGRENVLLADSALYKSQSKLSFHIVPNWCRLHIKNTTSVNIRKNGASYRNNQLYIKDSYVQFYNKRMVFINENIEPGWGGGRPLEIDYLVLTKEFKGSVSDLLKMYVARIIVFDGSVKSKLLLKRERECIAEKTPYYSIAKYGALEIEI